MLRPFTGNSSTARLLTTWLKIGVFGLQHRRRGLDFDVLGYVAELHRYVRARRTGHVHFDVVADGLLEATLFHFDAVLSRELGSRTDNLLRRRIASGVVRPFRCSSTRHSRRAERRQTDQ